MISNEFIKAFEKGHKPMPMATITVEKEIALSDEISTYIVELISEAERCAGRAGTPDLDVEYEEYLKFFRTLLKLCVDHCNYELPKEYRKVYYEIQVPVLFYQLLICVGPAMDELHAIQFIPKNPSELPELCSPEQLMTMSNNFLRLSRNGFAVVKGLPSTREGELDFMAMFCDGYQVLSYLESNPVYGFFASLTTIHGLDDPTDGLQRVEYGYNSDYRLDIPTLVMCKGGK